jgi:hypothetical protein
MKRAALFIVLVAAGMLAIGASAAGDGSGDLPEGVQVFQVEGKTCIRDVELGVLECWCTGECGGGPVCPVPTHHPTREPTKQPTEHQTATSTVQTAPTATPEPEPTDKPHCNRGLGNGPEDCDPGNSGGKPGKAGEDDG